MLGKCKVQYVFLTSQMSNKKRFSYMNALIRL